MYLHVIIICFQFTWIYTLLIAYNPVSVCIETGWRLETSLVWDSVVGVFWRIWELSLSISTFEGENLQSALLFEYSNRRCRVYFTRQWADAVTALLLAALTDVILFVANASLELDTRADPYLGGCYGSCSTRACSLGAAILESVIFYVQFVK